MIRNAFIAIVIQKLEIIEIRILLWMIAEHDVIILNNAWECWEEFLEPKIKIQDEKTHHFLSFLVYFPGLNTFTRYIRK